MRERQRNEKDDGEPHLVCYLCYRHLIIESSRSPLRELSGCLFFFDIYRDCIFDPCEALGGHHEYALAFGFRIRYSFCLNEVRVRQNEYPN